MRNFLITMIIGTTFLSFIGCTPESIEPETIDTSSLLLTLPTIENTLPFAEGESKDPFDLQILEDDWRQVELISSDYMDLIKEEIDSINLIVKTESVEIDTDMIAFKDLHVRTLIPEPLKSPLDLEQIKTTFKDVEIGSLTFYGFGEVKQGFSIDTSQVQLYGLIQDNKITVLGLYSLESWDNIKDFNADMKNLMQTEDLVFVDWRARQIVNSDEFDSYFKPNE